MEQKDSLLGVVQTLWHWRKPILTVCVIAVLGTAVISLFMPNYYKSTTVFLAASPDQAKPELLFGSGGNIGYYGNANDIDRLLTIAESYELVDLLVDSFDLYEHYNIDSTGTRAVHSVRQKFLSLYEVKKTKRDAIELSVEDRDKTIAAQLANAARDKVDALAQQLIKEGQQKAIRTFEQEINLKLERLRVLSDTVAALRSRFSVYNSVAQTENLTEQQSEAKSRLVLNKTRLEILRPNPNVPRDTIIMLNALVRGLEEEVKDYDVRMQLLNSGMGIVMTYEKQYFESNSRLSTDMERLKMWQSAYDANIPGTILIERGEVPIVKSRPGRTMWVLGAGAIAFVFSIIAVLLLAAYQEYWRHAFTEPSPAYNNDVSTIVKKKKKKRKKSEQFEGEGA